MSDHEFEKKVQQKMDELKLRPSEAVWKGVEMDLRRDKRRRRTLLWLPVMGILLLTGGYFLYTGLDQAAHVPVAQRQTTPAASSSEQGSVTPGAATGTTRDITGTDHSKNRVGDKKPLTERNKADINTVPVPQTKTADRQPVISKADNTVDTDPDADTRRNNRQQAAAGNEKGKKKVNTGHGKPKKDIKSSEKDKKADNKADNKLADPLQPVQKDDPMATSKDQDSVNTVAKDRARVPDPLPAKEGDAGKNNTDITGKSPGDSAAKATVAPDSAKQKAPPKVKDIVKNKKQPAASKWQWGIMASAGVTNISEGSVFNLLNRVRVDDLASAPLAYSGIPPVPDPEPSPIRTGPVFSAGAFVKRNISGRVSLSLGLQYSYASVYTKVGNRVDSLATVNFGSNSSRITGQYYRADQELHDYTNRYHFIDMPLELSVRINGNKRMPISFNGGITLSQLVYTNALHFDGFSKVYYENDDFYNKLQAGFNTSLAIGLFQDKKHPVSIGPSFRYYLSDLVKKEVTTTEGQHIWSAGLNVKMLLKK